MHNYIAIMSNYIDFFGRAHTNFTIPSRHRVIVFHLLLRFEDNFCVELHKPNLSLRWDINRYLLDALTVLCEGQIENTI